MDLEPLRCLNCKKYTDLHLVERECTRCDNGTEEYQPDDVGGYRQRTCLDCKGVGSLKVKALVCDQSCYNEYLESEGNE